MDPFCPEKIDFWDIFMVFYERSYTSFVKNAKNDFFSYFKESEKVKVILNIL